MNFNLLFTKNQLVDAEVKSVHDGSIHFRVLGASSAVLPVKDSSKGTACQRMQESLRVGAHYRMKVKTWYSKTRQIVFESFAEENGTQPRLSRAPSPTPKPKTRRPKPQYQLLPKDMMFLVDAANYIHEFKPEDYPAALSGLAAGLAEEGYTSHFFMEVDTFRWAMKQQEEETRRKAFQSVCANLGVTMVKKESDAVILQIMSRREDCVGLSNDHFADYATAYPDLVGSPRLREFEVFELGGEPMVSIDGVRRAIDIRSSEPKAMPAYELSELAPAPSVTGTDLGSMEFEEAVPTKPRHVREFRAPQTGGLVGWGLQLLKKGNRKAAANCFRKVAKKDGRGLGGLVDAYADDMDLAAKFQDLSERFRVVQRECALRSRRLFAERRRWYNAS